MSYCKIIGNKKYNHLCKNPIKCKDKNCPCKSGCYTKLKKNGKVTKLCCSKNCCLHGKEKKNRGNIIMEDNKQQKYQQRRDEENIIESKEIPEFNKHLINNLSEEETQYLKNLNSLGNYTSQSINNKSDLLEVSIKEILQNWSKTMKTILDELLNLEQLDKEVLQDDVSYWWKNIIFILKQIIKILFRGERKIYLGLTVIFITFLLFTIEITS